MLDAIRVLAGEGMTMLIVSHEMGFVREIAKKVVFMDEGKVVEVGSAGDIFDNPRRCVARTSSARSFATDFGRASRRRFR